MDDVSRLAAVGVTRPEQWKCVSSFFGLTGFISPCSGKISFLRASLRGRLLPCDHALYFSRPQAPERRQHGRAKLPLQV